MLEELGFVVNFSLLTKYLKSRLGEKVLISPESAKRRQKRFQLSLAQEESQKEKDRLRMKRRREEESAEAIAARNEKDKLRKKRRRAEESAEATAARRTNDKQLKKSKRTCQHRTTGDNVYNDNETKMSIERLMKEAKHVLHRTKDPNNPFRHRAIVCIICDCFIIGTEKIYKLTPSQIIQHSHRLSVQTYELNYGHELKPELRKQYQVNYDGLNDLLLSPRSRKYPGRGYATCAGCILGMRTNLSTKITPPKFSIANGFVIGSFPSEIEFKNKDGETVIRKIDNSELTDVLKAMLAPVRMYGYVFAYSGGSQKSIKGNFQFFEMDQNKLGAVMTQLSQAGIGEHIYVVLCGRMTPEQKHIVRTRSVINTQLFLDILTWFVSKSGHKGYENTILPEKCPQPVLIEDRDTNNNTDTSIDVNVETNIENATYHFSSAQEPTESTSVYGCMDKFAAAMLQRSPPSVLVSGGNFANIREMNIEDVLPFSFPFGLGGMNMTRQVKVSDALCIQHYMKLSLGQFMESETILILYQMYNRIKSYMNGVMTCRSNIDGITLGERISNLSMKDLEQIKNEKTDHLNDTSKEFLKAITTSCSAMGHTPEAAKLARRDAYSMLDKNGMNSVFVTTTPCDECTIRIQFYSKPQKWVSFHTWALFSSFEIDVLFQR